MRRVLVFTLALSMMIVVAAHAKVVGKEVAYQQGEATFTGYLAKNDAVKGKRPGVIVVHEWWGHNEHARNAATKLAEAGYAAFALDMYGEGKTTTHPETAESYVMEVLKDSTAVFARFNAALEQLKADPDVNPDKLGAIGFCFGGMVVLGVARAGADLDAVATFHGGLATNHPAEKGKVKAEILVLRGGSDPFDPPADLEAFEKEMTAAGAKYRIVTYPDTKHGFTNPKAGSYGMDALAYNPDAAKKSWDEMLKTFKKALK
jgi:dienelactone hydrolase